MSFQPQFPTVSPPPPPPVPQKGKRRKGLIVLGLILLVGGLLGGGAVATKGMSNYKDAVKSMARAPVGCTTTLVFDKPANFTIYAETKGKLGQLNGDCHANGTDYTHAGDKLPKFALTLVDSKGATLDLQRGVSASYDVGGYVGTAVRTVKITSAGTYRLDVESDDTDFAIAIGKNPKDDSELLTIIGGSVALGGLVIGVLLLLLGLRRRRPPPAAANTYYTTGPTPGWSPGPYGGPPPNAPPGPPATYPGSPGPPPAPVPQTVQYPGQPPIWVPEQPAIPSFAPPTFAPPAPPAPNPEPVSPPHVQPDPGPRLPPASSGGGWAPLPDDEHPPGDN